MALLDLTTAKSMLGISVSDTSKDAQYTALLPAADALVKQFLRRPIEQSTYTEYYSGNNTPFLALRQFPVTAVANVWEDSYGFYGNESADFPTATLLTPGQDYVLHREGSDDTTGSRSGLLVRVNYYWPEAYFRYIRGYLTAENVNPLGNIKVEYTAGYATVPADIQFAVAQLLPWLTRLSGDGGYLKKERIGDYEYEFMGLLHRPELGTVRQILNQYRDLY